MVVLFSYGKVKDKDVFFLKQDEISSGEGKGRGKGVWEENP